MSMCISYLGGDSLTKNAIRNLAISACATCLLTVPVDEYRSTRITSWELDIRVKAIRYIIMYDKAHCEKVRE